MKPVYLGGVRGYQSAVYRPGIGWRSSGTHRHHGRQPAVFKKGQSVQVSPLVVAYQRRPGFKARAAIVVTVAVVASMLALVLAGSLQF